MSDVDKRGLNLKEFPVWRKSVTPMTWATGAGHAAKTQTIAVNGIIKRIVMTISSVTGAPNVTATITDDLGNVIFSTGAKAHNTSNIFDEGELGSDAFCVCGDIIITVDPDADAGGAGQLLTVQFDMYGI